VKLMPSEEATNLKWSIRLASTTDAYRLAEIKSVARTPEVPDEHPRTDNDALDFLDRLALPHGDDYFCVVVEEDGQIVGYLIGGGSRDLDRKAHGEVYEIVVLPASRRQGAAKALLSDALERFDAAAFAGTLLSAPSGDDVIRRLAIGLGMRPDGPGGNGQPTTRYERALHPTSDQAQNL
jgi:ribosomal protein S18 acetylase RimI-like enzyme